MNIEIFQLAEKLGEMLKARSRKITIAESCTGGGICQALTAIAGSSEWFDRGFVTYSNNAKIEMLDVAPETLVNFGAVSKQTAEEMVEGALKNSNADCAISVTGIAGPGGGTKEKPVGTVYLAFVFNGNRPLCQLFQIKGDRETIRDEAIILAIKNFNKLCDLIPLPA